MSFAIKEVDENYYIRKRPQSKGKMPSVFKKPVDMSKVNLPVIKVWLEETIHEHLPEDDIAVEFIYELLKSEELLNVEDIQEQMNDFLGEKESLEFCEKLWKLLLSAQKDKDGIPEQLLEQRKKQLERDTVSQAQQMIAQLRLKPDYNRGRKNERVTGSWVNQSHHSHTYPSGKTEHDKIHKGRDGRRREQSPGRRFGSKTNYNRSDSDSRGSYNRDNYRRDDGRKYEKEILRDGPNDTHDKANRSYGPH